MIAISLYKTHQDIISELKKKIITNRKPPLTKEIFIQGMQETYIYSFFKNIKYAEAIKGELQKTVEQYFSSYRGQLTSDQMTSLFDMDQYISWQIGVTLFMLDLVKEMKEVSRTNMIKIIPKTFPDTSKLKELRLKIKEIKNTDDFKKFINVHKNILGLLLFDITLPNWNRDIYQIVKEVRDMNW